MKKIEDILKNEELMKIAHKASSRFNSSLSSDEIETCIMSAIWKALNKYDPALGSKFSTYLYNGIILECLTQKKFNLSNFRKISSKKYKNRTQHSDIDRVDMLDVLEKCKDGDIVYDYFYGGKTIKEIASEKKLSGETIRIKIKKSLNKIKKSV